MHILMHIYMYRYINIYTTAVGHKLLREIARKDSMSQGHVKIGIWTVESTVSAFLVEFELSPRYPLANKGVLSPVNY